MSPSVSVTTSPRHFTPAYMQQWNLNVQRQIGNYTLVEVGYVGSKGNHLGSIVQLNQVPPKLLGPGNAQLRRPYPNLGNITMGAGSAQLANSNYHSLQVRMIRRFQHGFSAQLAYTRSKNIDDCQTDGTMTSYGNAPVQDHYNLRAEKSVALPDQPNILSWAFVWELPFGKGRPFVQRGGVVNALLGGWNLSSLSSLTSGMPLVMGTVQNLTGSLSGGSRPNRLANGVLPGSERNIYRWFDPSAFTLPPPYTFGNDSRSEPQLRGPGAVNLSALLGKEFRFGERRYFEFRCQAGNVLNHFNPGMPNATIGGPGVGTITGGSGGRSLVLSLRLHY